MTFIAGLAALSAEAKASFQRFEISPYPAVRIITEPGHLKQNEYARAVLYDSGREEIWIAQEAVGHDALYAYLDHEAAHLKTWREHGPDVREHGVQWRRICRKHALSLRACVSYWRE